MAGMEVVVTKCDEMGNIDVADLRAKAEEHSANLSCLMVTYPSTHGVYEESIQEITALIHSHGGQVYMDGANMNAQVGPHQSGQHRCRCVPPQPAQDLRHSARWWWAGALGLSVWPSTLHAVPARPCGGAHRWCIRPSAAVSAAPWGSALILLISYALYERCWVADGAEKASTEHRHPQR
jgi:glycine dehydrogenase